MAAIGHHTPPGRAPFWVFPGGDCFCSRYLLSDGIMTNRAYAKKQWRCGDGLLSFSYPEPFLRAVRRGALAKSISELASDWLVRILTPDIVFLPCFCGIRLWIWPEPLVAPRVRRALGTRMDFCVVFNLVPRAIVEWMALGTRLCSILWWYSVLWFHVERLLTLVIA
jgi:hypothetical protein